MAKKDNGYDDYGYNEFSFRDDDDHTHNGRDDDGRPDNDHKHDDGNDDGFVHRDGSLIAAATDPLQNHNMYYGSGNPNTGWEIADNLKEHIELGLKIKERGGPDSPVVSDPHNVAHFQEDAGHDASGKADWNFDYSVDTLLGGGHATLNNFEFKLQITDNNAALNLHHTETFDLHTSYMGHTNVWVSESNPSHVFGGDDFAPHNDASASTIATQSQNSENIGFSAFAGFGSIDDRTAAGTQWDFKLIALEHHEVVAQVHNVVNLVPHDITV